MTESILIYVSESDGYETSAIRKLGSTVICMECMHGMMTTSTITLTIDFAGIERLQQHL